VDVFLDACRNYGKWIYRAFILFAEGTKNTTQDLLSVQSL
jgi:hypothetical protein